MSCIPNPNVTLPELPVGITIGLPPIPGITVPCLCCQLLDPFDVIPPFALPPLVANPAVLVALNTTLRAIETYINNLIPDCPRAG